MNVDPTQLTVSVSSSGTSVSITVTGQNARQIATAIENLSDSQRNTLGVTSNFAPESGSTSPPSSPAAESKLPLGAVVGGVVGGIVVLGAIGYFLYRRKSGGGDEAYESDGNKKLFAAFQYQNLDEHELQLNANDHDRIDHV